MAHSSSGISLLLLLLQGTAEKLSMISLHSLLLPEMADKLHMISQLPSPARYGEQLNKMWAPCISLLFQQMLGNLHEESLNPRCNF
jgi:hypothetical protein